MDKIIRKILVKLENEGFESYIVGGYVRDKIIGRKTYDVDIVTNALPKDLHKIFSKAPNNYGALNLKIGKYNIDITTYRREEYRNNKLIHIQYINNLLTDIKRRDFTINSLCMNKDDLVLDLLECESDIQKKVIKSIAVASTKIKEDPLRILRAIRFATILNFEIDDELKTEIKKNINLIKEIPDVKIKGELEKIWLSKNYKYGLKLISELGVKDVLNLQTSNIKKTQDILGMWAQISSESFLLNKRENSIIKRVNKINEITPKTIYEYGLYTNIIKSEIMGVEKQQVYKIYNKMLVRDDKPLKINALEIIDILNIAPSKKIEEIKEEIINLILEHKLKNNNKKIKNYLKGKIKNEK